MECCGNTIKDLYGFSCPLKCSTYILQSVICKKYLSHVQKSVFEGELTKSQLKKLTIELRKWIRDDKDSVIIFKNRNKKWLDKQFLGMDMSDETSNFF
ncbi:CRISPR-associated endonuclease Cas2 [Ligilactobacillus agilis]|uniref:CRISPR-associated endonuclease Cas2 n=1 Tax=Ligilactobacillus agilis TaxID=1601 RepID=UPI00186722F8|nr:CRISPR-associated endonuclease Cas2 [Ligilactobacillus agilis]